MKYLVHSFRIFLLSVVLTATAFSAKPAKQAYALGSTIYVDTAELQLDDTNCSLVEAIRNANDDEGWPYHVCARGTGNDRIEFTADVGTINLTYDFNGDMFPITDPDGLTIDGGGDVVIDGAYAHRLFYVDQAPLTLKNLHLINGYSDAGGAVYNYAGNLTVTNNVFTFNNAYYGGAIYNNYGILNIANSLFQQNFTVPANYDPEAKGGAVYINGGGGTFTNNTFYYSQAASTAADLYAGNSATVRLYNNIFAYNQMVGHCATEAGVDIYGRNNLFTNNSSTDGSSACGFTNIVNGNILGQDPAFEAGSVALSSSSPAIDAGINADCAAAPVNNTSYNGVSRPSGYRCDIGAYEYLQTPVSYSVIFYSTAPKDGHILESSETSNKGGSMNSTSTMLYIGDNAAGCRDHFCHAPAQACRGRGNQSVQDAWQTAGGCEAIWFQL